MKIKTSLLTLLLLLGMTLTPYVEAKNNLLGNATGVIQEISNLADEFNLTNEQKGEMRSVLMNYLPNIALKAHTMMNNRQDLLAASLTEDEIDEQLILSIAEQQGNLLTGIIIDKERMKKDIRGILTDNQKDFVDALIQTIIEFKLNHRS